MSHKENRLSNSPCYWLSSSVVSVLLECCRERLVRSLNIFQVMDRRFKNNVEMKDPSPESGDSKIPSVSGPEMAACG